MNVLELFIYCAWVTRIVWNILTYTHLWFVKEYRFDRMFIHLRTDQGRRILVPPFRRPPVSPKTVVLVGVTIVVSGIFLFTNLFPPLLSLFLIDLFLFPWMGLLVFFLQIPTFLYHELCISLALLKLKSHKKMITVGITGSFGKTSTKEYLSTILSRAYVVLKTPQSKNSPIGIAEVIMKSLTSAHTAFVVEMGAYKKGEIARMSEMVRPEIGMITAINEQHQDLFGSIDTTMQAKYELIRALTGKKIAIFNADNPYVYSLSLWAKKDGIDVWFVTTDLGKILQSDHVFYISNIRNDSDGIRFTIIYQKKRYSVTSKVIGSFQAFNITASVAAAVAAGMEIEEAVSACQDILPVPKMMQRIDGIHGSVYINDTFNNNPDAAIAALDYLETGKKRKILIFQPMIELGSFSESAHTRVGKRAGEVCDEIILTNTNFRTPFERGVRESGGSAHVVVLDASQGYTFLVNYLRRGDLVLFKGKEAEHILNLLTKKSL